MFNSDVTEEALKPAWRRMLKRMRKSGSDFVTLAVAAAIFPFLEGATAIILLPFVVKPLIPIVRFVPDLMILPSKRCAQVRTAKLRVDEEVDTLRGEKSSLEKEVANLQYELRRGHATQLGLESSRHPRGA